MPHLPLVLWMVVAGLALLLLGLCALTGYAVLRTTGRLRVARWPARGIAALVGAAAVPWLVVQFAPINIQVNVHGLASLIAWLLCGLLAFALLVLLPLTAVLSTVVWCVAARRRNRGSRPTI